MFGNLYQLSLFMSTILPSMRQPAHPFLLKQQSAGRKAIEASDRAEISSCQQALAVARPASTHNHGVKLRKRLPPARPPAACFQKQRQMMAHSISRICVRMKRDRRRILIDHSSNGRTLFARRSWFPFIVRCDTPRFVS